MRGTGKMHDAIGAVLLAACACAAAQTSPPGNPPREAADSGAIIMPPENDPAAKKKPAKPLREKAAKPGQNAIEMPARSRSAPPSDANTNTSREDDCKGPQEFCKQSSPR